MPQPFDFIFRDIKVCFNGTTLSVSNGKCFREWKLCNGWKTVSPEMERENKQSDWMITACNGKAVLLSVDSGMVKNNAGTEFVKTVSEFHYPESAIFLRHEIDCYPGVSGMRIQISLKHEKEISPTEPSPERNVLPQFVFGYTESVPLNAEEYDMTAFGLNNDSQHRYFAEAPILTEYRTPAHAIKGTETIGNCNGIILTKKDQSGFLTVKESNKCANSPGISTGEFLLKKDELISTGLGFSDGAPHWLSGEGYRWTWAHWYIPFTGGARGAIQALKEFDRARFPFRKERDMFIAMNTWGSRGSGFYSRTAAEEQNVLSELESCADLGIDLLQIDDGWQFDDDKGDFLKCDWTPSKVRFPEGWKNVKARAKELNMQLGLWVPPSFISAEQLMENIRSGGFRRIKFDFLNFSNRNSLDQTLEFTEKIVKSLEEPIGINWDTTEAYPRMGFYFGREYGNIFLQNCENSPPGMTSKEFIAYDPEMTLNQTWLLAKYFNLNQVQITIQRIAESARRKGYSQDYACGIALMGNPLFFMETRRFTEEERAVVKSVISAYKPHREKILTGYVDPIGETPDGASWCGFQCRCSDSEGYLTIFREKQAPADNLFLLNLPDGKQLRLTGLYQAQDTILNPDPDGGCHFPEIPAGSWAFYHYSV